MRPAAVLAAAAAAGVLALGALAASKPTVRSADNPALGAILVGATGLTLYHYADDHGSVVKCNGACAQQWPPVLVAANAKPVAGPGLASSKLGTVKRPDGTIQVTYGGYALYRFAGDRHGGEVNGQGFEKEWYAVAPSGKIVKQLAAAAKANGPTTSSSPGSSSSSSAGGSDDMGAGYGY
jgi:predicted lipoprotein with Yx(FWY)xxD motif